MPRNWLPVVGYEGLYEVSDHGEIRRNNHILRQEITPNNRYPRVSLCKHSKVTRYHVHTLVLNAFRGLRPKGMCCRHLNDIPTDNQLQNLVWGTHRDNFLDSRKNGGWKPRGKDTNPREFIPHFTVQGKKVHLQDIPKIKELVRNGTPQWQVAKMYGLHQCNISRIVSGKRWIYAEKGRV